MYMLHNNYKDKAKKIWAELSLYLVYKYTQIRKMVTKRMAATRPFWIGSHIILFVMVTPSGEFVYM